MIIGRHAIHSSHKPYIYRGLVYCNKCGAYSGTGRQVVKLSAPCVEPKRWGKDNKKAIDDGKLPRGLAQWPADQINGQAFIDTPLLLSFSWGINIGPLYIYKGMSPAHAMPWVNGLPGPMQ